MELATYTGNDLNYENIYDQAYSIVTAFNASNRSYDWKDIITEAGYILNSLNSDDYELAKDATEQAMMDYEFTNSADPDIDPSDFDEAMLSNVD